ncbi:MAG TPA: DegV family protein [Jatrophihabitantaceae bacterium]|jgi:DegV family protein with EDD domain|nr:DegV family protein [Jatrophihabitantaceae bacterium]
MTVAVVTDSTSYLPPGAAARTGVEVVALRVTVGERTGVDGIEVSSADVTKALRDRVSVTTSRPAPAEFAAAYQAALDAGASNIVSVHVSAALSGTWESARLAAQDFGFGTVRVVDSRSTGMALGFAVLAAAQAAMDGATAAAVQDAAVATAERTFTTFYVDSFEYLRRGGRVGTATALLGTSLSVKPLLHVANGEIQLLEKVRTSTKALARLLQRTVEAAGDSPIDIAVHHLDAGQRADDLAGKLRAALPRLERLYISEVGAVLGAHLGPGALGTVVVRR